MDTIDRAAEQADNADVTLSGDAAQVSTQENAKQRMDAAFARLRNEHVFVAEPDFECCNNCALTTIMDAAEERGQNLDEVRYVFYHAQDAEAWLGDELAGDLYLSHDGDASQLIVDVLRDYGFDVKWDGDMAKRICVGRTILL